MLPAAPKNHRHRQRLRLPVQERVQVQRREVLAGREVQTAVTPVMQGLAPHFHLPLVTQLQFRHQQLRVVELAQALVLQLQLLPLPPFAPPGEPRNCHPQRQVARQRQAGLQEVVGLVAAMQNLLPRRLAPRC